MTPQSSIRGRTHLLAFIFWRLTIAASLGMKDSVVEQARQQAKAALATQTAVHRFVTRNGGIYARMNQGAWNPI